jgi:amino acid transporter
MRASTGVKLGVLSLAMINVAAIVSARNLPVMAEYGWSMLALFAISILVFLVPIAMVAAELGTAWCKEGGVFAWVKEAFGAGPGSSPCGATTPRTSRGFRRCSRSSRRRLRTSSIRRWRRTSCTSSL